MPSGGGGAPAAPAAGAADAGVSGGEAAPPEETKKEEPAEESDEDVRHIKLNVLILRWVSDCSIKIISEVLCVSSYRNSLEA